MEVRVHVSWFFVCLLFPVTFAMTCADDAHSGNSSAEPEMRRHSATSNPVSTKVLPAEDSRMPVENTRSPGSRKLIDLQKRKQQSMTRLNQRAEQLMRAWKAKEAKEALAKLHAQKRSRQLAMEAAERDRAAARDEQQAKNAAENAPPKETPAPTVARPQPEAVVPVPQPPVVPVPPLQGPDEGIETIPASVDGPIDRMALATSLFGTGSFRECLQTIEAVDRDAISIENQDWCEYVSACCYRKMGNLPEAESRYRELLGRTEFNWLANATRWWLDHLNDQKKLRDDIQALNSNLLAWKKEIDGLRTTN